MSSVPPPLPGQKSTVALVILHSLQALSLLPWVFVAGMTVMVFDSPDSTKKLWTWTFALTIWCYPAWIALAAVGSWFLHHKGHYLSAVLLAILFTLPPPLFVLFIFLAA